MGEILTWFGNILNFLIVAYLFRSVVYTQCFEPADVGIAVIGLVIGILIQIYNITEKW